MMKLLKAIKSLWTGLLATVSPKNFADCGVNVDGFRIAEFRLVETAGMVARAAIDCDIASTAKLGAAAAALRQIECQTQDGNYPMDICDQKAVHTIAQNAWRATQA